MNESGTGQTDSPRRYPPTPTRGPRSAVGATLALVLGVVLVVSIPVLLGYHRNTAPGPATPAPASPGAPVPSAAGTPPAASASAGAPSATAASTTVVRPAPVPAPEVPRSGSGQVRVAGLVREAPGRQGRRVRVRVEVEKELSFDADDVARQAADTLQDQRSWTGRGAGVHFDFVGTGDSDLTILVATPDTVDRRCRPLDTGGQVSCQNGRSVNINARRWAEAVPDYRGDVPLYRQYVVNHEVGHYLGHGHVSCPGRGKVAPVMQQQTKGLAGCLANPWP